MLITTAHDDIFITFETYVEWSYITCTHITGPLLVCHYDCTPPYLIYHSSLGVGLMSPLTLRKEKEEGRRHIYTYFHLLFFDFKQVIAQRIK